jgi:hypothetical protein
MKEWNFLLKMLDHDTTLFFVTDSADSADKKRVTAIKRRRSIMYVVMRHAMFLLAVTNHGGVFF